MRGTKVMSQEIAATNANGTEGRYHRSVQALAELIERDGIVRMHVTQMVDQVPDEHKTIHNIDELLSALNHIVHSAPKYSSDPK